MTAYFILKQQVGKIGWLAYAGLGLFIISLNGFFHLLIEDPGKWNAVLSGRGGGYIGWIVSTVLLKLVGPFAGYIVLLALMIIAFLLLFNTSLSHIFGYCAPFEKLCKKGKNFDDDIIDGK